MKKLLLVVVLLLQFTTYAQDSIPVKNNITTADELIDKYSTQAYEAVKELATALQVPAEYVFTILVKQAVVEAFTILVILIVGIILLIGGIIFTLKEAKINRGHNEAPAEGIIGTISLIISLFMLLYSIVNFSIMIGGFINPEYYAIKEVLSLIK